MTLACHTLLTDRPPRRSYLTGPGSLEMIEITTWTRCDIGWVRIHGHFDVFCGNGGTHRIPVDEKAWASDYSGGPLDEAAHELVEVALDGWTDPCEAWTTTHRSLLDGSEVRMVGPGLAQNENGDLFDIDPTEWEETT